MPQKRYLLTPGPTPVPPEVLAALAEPVIHHRSPDFKTVFLEVLERLHEVFRTQNDILVFTASGTGAFESAFANLLSPGEKALVVSHGEFGTRWQKLGAALRRRRRPAHVRVGRGSREQRTSRASLAESGAAGRVHRALGDLDRRRLGHPVARRRLQRSRRDLGRRRDLEPRRRAARDGRVGDRRRRDRVAEGPDDAAGARVRVDLAAGVGEGGAVDAAALLLGLGTRSAARRRRGARRSRPRPRSSSR